MAEAVVLQALVLAVVLQEEVDHQVQEVVLEEDHLVAVVLVVVQQAINQAEEYSEI